MAAIDLRTVRGAVAVRWIREDHHLQVLAERDQAEGLLVAAESRIKELERHLAQQRRPIVRRRPHRRGHRFAF